MWLTVPVNLEGHTEKTIRQIPIVNDGKWQTSHLKSIEQAYARTPYLHATDFLQRFGREVYVYASDVSYLTEWLAGTIGIHTPIYRQSRLDIDKSKRKGDLILELCKYFKADVFLFGEHGKEYADESAFREAGVTVRNQIYVQRPYPQRLPGWTANLSVLDSFFNIGPRATGERCKASL
jgi:hypothetical protein